jgi:hypothetical protein
MTACTLRVFLSMLDSAFPPTVLRKKHEENAIKVADRLIQVGFSAAVVTPDSPCCLSENAGTAVAITCTTRSLALFLDAPTPCHFL